MSTVRPGYKQTEMGVIPEDWEPLKMLAAASRAPNAIVGGPFGSDLVSTDYVATGVPVIRGQNMGSKYVGGDFVFVSEQKAKQLAANCASVEDLVFTQRGTLGQVSLCPSDRYNIYLISQSQMKISLDLKEYSPEYFYYYFTSPAGQKQIIDSAIQTGLPHTNLGILRQYQLPIPKKREEQQAIAEALGDADALIEALEALIAKKRDIKQGAMQDLLTGRRRLPGFQGEWAITTLAEVSEFITKGATPTTYGFLWQSSGVLFLRSECISDWGLDLTQSMFISDEAHRATIRSEIKNGDLLITITGNVGRVVQYVGPEPANINQHVARVRIVSPEIDPRFVFHYLSQTVVRHRFSQITTGQAYPQLSLVQVRNTGIPRPTLDEQRAIAAVLSDMDSEIAALEDKLAKARAVKQGMMQVLLTGEIRLV